jgi:tRNA A37 threonylcarbamoyladenosine synthetase subunit TsaC/SUA5/YrdC
MAYGLIATRASAINAAKGRPEDQAVAVSLHDEDEWRHLAPSIDVPPAALGAVITLLDRRLSLLLPLRREVPPPRWLGPAVQDGYVCLFNGRWARTTVLWERFPRLFGSSANHTGEPPVASAAQARAMFGGSFPVVEAGSADDPPRRRIASTMIRLDRDGCIALHRTGIHDATGAYSPSEFLQHLAGSTGLAIQADAATARGERS